MRKILFLTVLSLVGSHIIYSQHTEGLTSARMSSLNMLKTETFNDLTNNILPFWTANMIDTTRGGFFGRIDGLNQVYPDADKGGILNARILWTYSAAFTITGDSSHLLIARRARDYIVNHFLDRENGGAYMSVRADGSPGDTRKQVYTNAFFIYALSEYSDASGDIESLDEALSLFHVLEQYATDREYNGYYELFSQKWERLRERMIGETSEKDEKTMNTHLHLLEAYANLYRLSGDRLVGERLRNLIGIFLEKIIDKNTSHLICFMDRNWNSTSTIHSYGHDIESSWLLYEAAVILGDKELIARAEKASLKIAGAAAEGYQPDGSMLTEKDFATGHISARRSWWEQAETVVGYLNAFELSGDEDYLMKSMKSWEYIKNNFIDKEKGGWFSYISDKGVPSGDKGGYWICPYHNGRMCIEVTKRIKGTGK